MPKRPVDHVSLCILLLAAAQPVRAAAVNPSHEICPRPAPGALVPEPKDLRSENGTLHVELHVRNQREPDGSWRFCYVLAGGAQAPTLRLHPGDLLVLHLNR